MSSDASAIVTMPEPMSMLTDFCDWASRQPESAVRALATQSPTIVVNDGVDGGGAHHIGVIAGGADGKTEPGLQEEAEEDAHKHDRDDRDERAYTARQREVPASRSFMSVKTLGVLFILRTEEPPMTAMLIE